MPQAAAWLVTKLFIKFGLAQWMTTAVGAKVFAAAVFAVKAVAVVSAGLALAKSLMPKMPPFGTSVFTGNRAATTGKIIYGITRVGGEIVFMRGSANSEGGGEKWQQMNIVVEVASHPIEGFWGTADPFSTVIERQTNAYPNIYVEDRNALVIPNKSTDSIVSKLFVGTGTTDTNGHTRWVPRADSPYFNTKGINGRIFFQLFDGTQTTTSADFITNCANNPSSEYGPQWTTNHKGQGKAYVYYALYYASQIWQTGQPAVSFDIQGKNDIFDPRSSTTGWSNNPALCLANYLTMPKTAGGLGSDWAEIDTTSLIEAANICDEVVGIGEARYTCNGVIETSAEPVANIQIIAETMDGTCERINGKWFIRAGHYETPVVTLTENELVTPMSLSLNRSESEKFNQVRPIIANAESKFRAQPQTPVVAETVAAVSSINVSTDVITTSTAHGFSSGDRVKFIALTGFGAPGTLPTGIDAEFYYWVKTVPSTTSFTISETEGGATLDITSNVVDSTVAMRDLFLSKDKERVTQDVEYRCVTSWAQARRLASIALWKSRLDFSMELVCKLGTTFCQPFDLRVGDSVYVINQHKSLFVPTGTAVNVTMGATGLISGWAHGMGTGQALILTNVGPTGLYQNRPYYVRVVSGTSLYLTPYRGGPDITNPEAGGIITVNKIRGKEMYVQSWKFEVANSVPQVRLGLVEYSQNIYEYDSTYDPNAPEENNAFTPKFFESKDAENLQVFSGTNELVFKDDGTVATGVRLTWNDPNFIFVSSSGSTEIEYKKSVFYDATINASTDVVTTDTPHGLSNGDPIIFTGAVLPTEITSGTLYYVGNVTTDTFKVYPTDDLGTAINFTSAGSTIQVHDQRDYSQKQTVAGAVTEGFIYDKIEDGVEYDFRVRHRSSFGYTGDWSTVVAHTVLGKTVAPNPPSLPAATYVNGENKIVLTWQNPSDKDLAQTLVERSVSLPMRGWENYAAPYNYSTFTLNPIFYPEGFAATKTTTTDQAFAFIKVSIFTFPVGSQITVGVTYKRNSGNHPRMYGINSSNVQCTETRALTSTGSETLTQFFDFTVASNGPCSGFVIGTWAHQTADFEITYFNARQKEYEQFSEVPAGDTRGKTGTAAQQAFVDLPVTKSNFAQVYYYKLSSIDTTGNKSTAVTLNRRAPTWELVDTYALAGGVGILTATWVDTGLGYAVDLELFDGFGNRLGSQRFSEDSGTGSFYALAPGTYFVVARLVHDFSGLDALSLPLTASAVVT